MTKNFGKSNWTPNHQNLRMASTMRFPINRLFSHHYWHIYFLDEIHTPTQQNSPTCSNRIWPIVVKLLPLPSNNRKEFSRAPHELQYWAMLYYSKHPAANSIIEQVMDPLPSHNSLPSKKIFGKLLGQNHPSLSLWNQDHNPIKCTIFHSTPCFYQWHDLLCTSNYWLGETQENI